MVLSCSRATLLTSQRPSLLACIFFLSDPAIVIDTFPFLINQAKRCMQSFRFIIWIPTSHIALLLGLFQFIFILCHEDNVAENSIYGTAFLVPIVKVFITIINMNGFKTSCDAESSKSVVHSICDSWFLSPAYKYVGDVYFQAKGQLQASSCLSWRRSR